MKLNDTQYELAIRTGLARKTINAMENGRFWIGMKQYILICEALHLFPAVNLCLDHSPVSFAGLEYVSVPFIFVM